VIGVHQRKAGVAIVIRCETRTSAGDLVNEQYETTFAHHHTVGSSVGEDATGSPHGGGRPLPARVGTPHLWNDVRSDPPVCRGIRATAPAIPSTTKRRAQRASRVRSRTVSSRWRSAAARLSRPPAAVTPTGWCGWRSGFPVSCRSALARLSRHAYGYWASAAGAFDLVFNRPRPRGDGCHARAGGGDRMSERVTHRHAGAPWSKCDAKTLMDFVHGHCIRLADKPLLLYEDGLEVEARRSPRVDRAVRRVSVWDRRPRRQRCHHDRQPHGVFHRAARNGGKPCCACID